MKHLLFVSKFIFVMLFQISVAVDLATPTVTGVNSKAGLIQQNH